MPQSLPRDFLTYWIPRYVSTTTWNNAHLKLTTFQLEPHRARQTTEQRSRLRARPDEPVTLVSFALPGPFPSVFFCLDELLLLPLSLPRALLDLSDEDWLTVLFREPWSCLGSFCRAGAAGDGSKSFSLTALGFEDLDKTNKFKFSLFSLKTNETPNITKRFLFNFKLNLFKKNKQPRFLLLHSANQLWRKRKGIIILVSRFLRSQIELVFTILSVLTWKHSRQVLTIKPHPCNRP